MTENCPHCLKPVRVDPAMFRSDDDEVIEICTWCDGEVIVCRRAIRFEYTTEKP
jgi:hypothetical protein